MISAHLQLYAAATNLKEPVKLVDAHLVTVPVWTEETVTYATQPAWTADPVATTAVYGPGLWYTWDVTASLRQQQGTTSAISYLTRLRGPLEGDEEEVVFASRDFEGFDPRLVVTYTVEPGIAWWVWALGAMSAVLVAGLAFVGGRLVTKRS